MAPLKKKDYTQNSVTWAFQQSQKADYIHDPILNQNFEHRLTYLRHEKILMIGRRKDLGKEHKAYS